MDIQLILEFINSFGKYHQVFLKNPQRGFLGHLVIIYILHLFLFSFLEKEGKKERKVYTVELFYLIINIDRHLSSENHSTYLMVTYFFLIKGTVEERKKP